jgi:hypothetical protein
VGGREEALTDSRACTSPPPAGRALPAWPARPHDRTPELEGSHVTVIGNTGDDITLFGLRVCPDLDTVLYTLGGVNEAQGWGARTRRTTSRASSPHTGDAQWFGLGDRDVGTHVARRCGWARA